MHKSPRNVFTSELKQACSSSSHCLMLYFVTEEGTTEVAALFLNPCVFL